VQNDDILPAADIFVVRGVQGMDEDQFRQEFVTFSAVDKRTTLRQVDNSCAITWRTAVVV
jgi:hypothetical protein